MYYSQVTSTRGFENAGPQTAVRGTRTGATAKSDLVSEHQRPEQTLEGAETTQCSRESCMYLLIARARGVHHTSQPAAQQTGYN